MVDDSITDTGTFSVADGGRMNFGDGMLTNLVNGVLTGGTYEVGANSTLQLPNNAAVTDDNADIILSGTSSTIEEYNSSASEFITIEQTLQTIGSKGELQLLAGRNWTTPNGAITNDGVTRLGGGTLSATGSVASLTDAAGSQLRGFGTVDATSFSNSGLIEATGGKLTIGVGVSGAGLLQIDGGANLVLAGAIASRTSANFSGDDAILTFKSPSKFAATIGGFSYLDTIQLAGLVANSATVVGDQLIVSENGTTVDTISLNGAYSGYSFVTTPMSGAKGTNVIALPIPATIAQYLGAVADYDLIPDGFSISDTEANITTNLGSLNDFHINRITISDNTPITLAYGQLSSESGADRKTRQRQQRNGELHYRRHRCGHLRGA